MTPPGWEEHPSAPAADALLLSQLATLPVTVIGDALGRLRGTVTLRPYHRDPAPFAGTAVTVHTRSGDNLAIYRSFAHCRPGDVLVVDGGGELTQALMGEIMTRYAARVGICAVVLDGAVRDIDAIASSELPVYARGVTHRGPYKTGPGRINVPVVIDRCVVQPGDIVVGDADGVLALHPDEAREVLAAAQRLQAKEQAQLDAIPDEGLDLSWVGPRTRLLQ